MNIRVIFKRFYLVFFFLKVNWKIVIVSCYFIDWVICNEELVIYFFVKVKIIYLNEEYFICELSCL